jgi:hypothetical protein
VPNGDGTFSLKWLAIAVPTGRSTLRMIAHSISQKTLANVVDVEAIILALVEEIPERLVQGQIVELPPLGNFRLTILNNGSVANRDDWSLSLIKGGHLIYDAPKALREIAKNAPLVQWINREAEAVLNHAHDVENRVREAEADLASAQRLIKRLAADAAAHPDDKTKAALLDAAQVQEGADRLVLDDVRKELQIAQAAAKRVEDDLNHDLGDSDDTDTPTTE